MPCHDGLHYNALANIDARHTLPASVGSTTQKGSIHVYSTD